MTTKDLQIDQYLQPEQNDAGVFLTVGGLDEFHQSVVIRLHDRIGDTLTDESIEKIQLAVTRVAREHDKIDEIANISVQRSRERPDTVNVTIQYVSGETFQQTINS